MAHVLLHLASLRLLEADPNLHPLGREALKRRRGLVQLGAVLCDLPHFQAVVGAAVSTLLGKDVPSDPWASKLHHGKAMALGRELVQRRENAHPLGPLGRLALAMGYFSHAALDASLHPQLHKIVHAQDTGLDAANAHRRVERVQAMLILPRLTGVELDQDQATWAGLQLASLADLQRTLEHVDEAVGRVHGDAPGISRWHGWLDGLQRYGQWMPGRMAMGEGGKVDVEAMREAWFTAPRFEDAFLVAQARSVAWVNRVCMAFAAGDVDAAALQDLATEFPEVDLDADVELPSANLGAELAIQRELGRLWRAHSAALQARDNTAMAAQPKPAPIFSEPPLSVAEADFHADDADLPPPPESPLPQDVERTDPMAQVPTNPLRPPGRAPR